MATGTALTYSLETLQSRGKLFLGPGDEIYEGQLAGINSRDNDLVINPTKGKKLDNMRASGKDEVIALVPPIRFTLEQALEFIADDELVEVTPKSIRMRKGILSKELRMKQAAARSRKGVVGSTGRKMPITPRATLRKPTAWRL